MFTFFIRTWKICGIKARWNGELEARRQQLLGKPAPSEPVPYFYMAHGRAKQVLSEICTHFGLRLKVTVLNILIARDACGVTDSPEETAYIRAVVFSHDIYRTVANEMLRHEDLFVGCYNEKEFEQWIRTKDATALQLPLN